MLFQCLTVDSRTPGSCANWPILRETGPPRACREMPPVRNKAILRTFQPASLRVSARARVWLTGDVVAPAVPGRALTQGVGGLRSMIGGQTIPIAISEHRRRVLRALGAMLLFSTAGAPASIWHTPFAVRTLSALAPVVRISRHRHRPGHRAAHHSPPRRARLGRSASGSRRHILLYTGVKMANKTILLIEDNPSDIELTRRALERSHVANELVVVQDGQEALDYLFGSGAYAGRELSALPGVTLLDLHLPKVPGLEVLRAIRADPRTRRMPVVILTSSNEEPDLAASYDLGVNSYIQKPVDFESFSEAIRTLGLYWLMLNEPPPKAV